MSGVIHFPERYKEALMEGFNKASETDSLFSHELDTQFSGVKTVHVMSLKTEPLQDYDRSIQVGTASRYGATTEVTDEVQTFTMTQDKSLSLSIDKGNNKEQFNLKKAGAVMKAERDEVIIPEVDRYRLAKWAAEAGIHKAVATPTKDNIVEMIMELHNEQLEKAVPDQITLAIARQYLPALKLAPEWVGLDSLGGKTLPSGSIGEFDGMAVKPFTTNRMPENVPFMLIYKGAIIAPTKINDFKGHVDPPGLSGDLLEFRMLYDAFVLGKKANGVAVAVTGNKVCATPTLSKSGNTVTIASTTSGATLKYTLDGADPRYSADAQVTTGSVTVAAGDKLRAYASKDGMFASAVVEANY